MSKALIYVVSVIATSLVVSAHYTFSQFIVNNSVSENWEYVRNVTTGFQDLFDHKYQNASQDAPYYDLYDENIRCGRGATTSGDRTKTAIVIAGEDIGFKVGVGYTSATRPSPSIYHLGPGQAYMSKAPGNIASYTGDGDWFKIGSVLAKNDRQWAATDQSNMTFNIPKTTPPGKYLVRVEHLFLSSGFNRTQFYVNCAQVEVVGPGGGDPGPMVKFPGAYDVWDPSIWVPREFGDSAVFKGCSKLTRYVPPGPPVWSG